MCPEIHEIQVRSVDTKSQISRIFTMRPVDVEISVPSSSTGAKISVDDLAALRYVNWAQYKESLY